MFFRKRKSKIGLALGSGAARGLDHIGVLKALKEENVSIHALAGSSMGALVGACYAREGEISNLEEIMVNIDWKSMLRLADPNLALLYKGVIHGKKVKELLKTLIGDIEFKDLKIPFAAVATDANTGEELIIRSGSVVEAVRASISIPAIFTPVKLNGRFLIDGGIVNPVPVSVVKDMGATFVIACNVIHKPQKRMARKGEKKRKLSLPFRVQAQSVNKILFSGKNMALEILNRKINSLILENKDKIQSFQKIISDFKMKVHKGTQKIDPATPNIFAVLIQAIYAMEYDIARSKAEGADLVIIPDTGGISALEFYRGKEAIAEGYKAAKFTFSTKKADITKL